MRYDAANLIDGFDDTAWRVTGDGTGVTITISLSTLSRITSVGLLPGYAKVDPFDGTDRWPQNRRPTAVEWVFDDGTTVRQDLIDAPTMQEVVVSARSSTIVVRILGVTAPTTRDFTAISELLVR